MIKSAIATAILASSTVATTTVFAAAHAKADKSVTVYGRLRMAVICQDDAAGDNECALENRSSRFGIKASSAISDGLTAFGKYEFGTQPDEGFLGSTSGTNRLGYVGLKGGFGEVSIGTRWSPLYTHTMSPIDWPNAFGATSQPGGIGYQSDFRNSDTINYGNKFGAAKVDVQLQMDDSTGEQIDEVSIGASFKAGSVNIGVGYQDNEAADDSVIAVMVNSTFGPVFVGGTISSSDAKDSLMLAANYSIGGGKGINLTYGMDDADGSDNTPTSIGLEYVHTLGGGFKWFAGFVSNDADVAGQDSTDQYGAGMRYDF